MNMFKKGYKQTKEHKKKIRDAQIGVLRPSTSGELNPAKRKEVREKISLALKGKKKSPEHIAKIRLVSLGRKLSDETKIKMSNSAKKLVQNGTHHFWKGGITGWQRKIRESLGYRLWRKSVFERDNYTCIICGYKSHKRINGKSDIHADHKKPFALYPKLRLTVGNGQTLCIDCHRKTETFGNKLIYQT